ncbi:PWWP domain-containing protein 3-like [Argentina anserina]|uniref:PWWP domain-containing protein 3-like n=1 Tax=Argentina anserina TaxID=57926 RepID=UPI002176737F|nr:PWWP domain-containing protein 3-like [Potentilla anserina]
MGTLGRSTALAEGSGSGSGAVRFEVGDEKTTAVDDSGGTRVGPGMSGGELVRSFVELVHTVEAKVPVGMSFGELDTCMSRFRGSESVGDDDDERKLVSVGSETAEENGNSCGENKAADSGVEEENGNSSCSGVNDAAKENGNVSADSGVNDGVEENGKCLDEIGGNEVVGASGAGKSENGEDEVGEEAGDGGYEFCVGDFVWGKIKNHPWWPGQICDPADASEHAAKLKAKDKLLVAYFGDGTFAWCHPSQLKPFEENFVENSKLSSSKVFVIAVQQAVDEIGRLVRFKMSCGCMGEEFPSGSNRPLAQNAGVKEGVDIPEGRVGKFFGHLSQPIGLLAELKRVAQVASLTSVLELNVLKSLLSAFYYSKGGYELPVYIEPQLIPGLEDEQKMVEVPVQWPSDDNLSSPVGSNTENAERSLLHKSPPSIENRQPHNRKEKSITDLLAEANDVDFKNKEGVTSEKHGVSSRRKKQKSSYIHGEAMLASESSKEKGKVSGLLVKDNQADANLHERGSGKRDIEKKQVMKSDERTKKRAAETEGESGKRDIEKKKLVLKSNKCTKKQTEGESGKRDTGKEHVMKSDKVIRKQAAVARSSKRRKLNSVIKSLGEDNAKAENLPVNGRGKRNINNKKDKPEKKQAPEPPISELIRGRRKRAEARDWKIKEAQEKASPASLFVTFGPGSSLPTKDDLLEIYSKFGELDETETEMFYTNFCARVAFVMSSDAEEAFNYSLLHSPFGASNVNFRLQNPSSASNKTRELSALPESPPAKKKGRKTASKASVASQRPSGQPSQVGVIRHKLEMISSMLGKDSVQEVSTSKLQNEIKKLLQVVSTMDESSA